VAEVGAARVGEAPTLRQGATIGILGGGQLGRMLSVAASRLGFRTCIFEPGGDCPASHAYSKGYLNHLFRAGEYLGPMLLTWHNLAYFQTLMADMRVAIAEGRFGAFVEGFKRRTGETIV